MSELVCAFGLCFACGSEPRSDGEGIPILSSARDFDSSPPCDLHAPSPGIAAPTGKRVTATRRRVRLSPRRFWVREFLWAGAWRFYEIPTMR